MCTGLEFILPLIGAGLSAAGTAVTMNEQQKQAERQAEARNEELRRTLGKNDMLAQQSRDEYLRRQQDAKTNNMDQKIQQKQRTKEAVQQIDTKPQTVADVPLAGDAPAVIKSDIAKKMSDALGRSKAEAAAQAKLGSFGDAWLNQGFKDQALGRDLSVNQDFANGNMALLPYQQDFAEFKATKPISPAGALLSGFGGLLSGFGGSSGSALPKKTYTSPWVNVGPGPWGAAL